MSFVIVLLALALLMFVAYRGFSVVVFAPICALLAVLSPTPRSWRRCSAACPVSRAPWKSRPNPDASPTNPRLSFATLE
jgi:hypothetical protein